MEMALGIIVGPHVLGWVVAAALTRAAMLSALLFPMAGNALLVRWPTNAERYSCPGSLARRSNSREAVAA